MDVVAERQPVSPLPSKALPRQWRRPVYLSTTAVGIAAALLLLYLFDPATALPIPPCPFHALTGLHCPGCGTLRATHALLNARPLAALALNPLYVLLLGAITAGTVRRALAALLRRPTIPLSTMIGPAWIYGLAITICLYWIIRNLPWPPFTHLAP